MSRTKTSSSPDSSAPSQQAGFSEPGPEGPVAQQERGGLDEIKIRSALDPIGGSPFLHS